VIVTGRKATFGLLMACSLGAVWWLFGFTVGPKLSGVLRTYRFFGRVTRGDIDMNGDGIVEQSFRYS